MTVKKEGMQMKEQNEELEKIKDQIRSMRISILVLNIAFFTLVICFTVRNSQIQNLLVNIVRCLKDENLTHQLILSMNQVF